MTHWLMKRVDEYTYDVVEKKEWQEGRHRTSVVSKGRANTH
jgi:hypothetical protein